MRIIAIIFMLMTATMPAFAQQHELSTGMHHIYVTRPEAPEKPALEKAGEPEEDKAKVIWNRYKALAAGTAQEPQESDNAPKVPPVEKPTVQAPATANETPEPTSATGIVGIIDQYRKNKEKQSQMKTLRFEQPTTQSTKTQ